MAMAAASLPDCCSCSSSGRRPALLLPARHKLTKPRGHVLVWAKRRSGFSELLVQKREAEKQQGKPVKLRPGRVSPRLPVPEHIERPPYVGSTSVPPFRDQPQIHDDEGIKRMRAAGELAARVRDFGGTLVKPGVTTDEIDKAVHKMIVDAGAYPSPLGYGGFPKSVCTSVNECICHGIPDSRPLQDGDIINIDVTVFLNGYHGDTSATFLCGENVSEEAKKLVEVTRQCLERAIQVCGPRVEFNKIGKAIQLSQPLLIVTYWGRYVVLDASELADKHKYGVVRRFVGHGIGTVFHCAPSVLHFRNNEPGRMQVGQTFTIEPMLTLGKPDDMMWDDNWTAVTADGSLSAQFEHTLLITDTGAEVLTACAL